MHTHTPIPVPDGQTTPRRVGSGHYKLGENDLLVIPSNPVAWQVWSGGRRIEKRFPTKRSAVAFVLIGR
jgi:hypothetical protein